MKGFFKVVSCGELQQVSSQKIDGGVLSKRSMVLQEFGGKFEDTFSVTLLGNNAQCQLYAGDVIVGALRFTTREVNGNVYQDVVLNDFHKID